MEIFIAIFIIFNQTKFTPRERVFDMTVGGNVNPSWVCPAPPTPGLKSEWCINSLANFIKNNYKIKVFIIKTSPGVKWNAGPEGFLPFTAVSLVSGS